MRQGLIAVTGMTVRYLMYLANYCGGGNGLNGYRGIEVMWSEQRSF
jgi:hypothetical protein